MKLCSQAAQGSERPSEFTSTPCRDMCNFLKLDRSTVRSLLRLQAQAPGLAQLVLALHVVVQYKLYYDWPVHAYNILDGFMLSLASASVVVQGNVEGSHKEDNMRRIAKSFSRALSQAQPLLQSEISSVSTIPVRQFSAAPQLYSPTHIQDEPYCRQRQLLVLGNRVPALSQDGWVAPNAVIVGDVDLYDKVRNLMFTSKGLSGSSALAAARLRLVCHLQVSVWYGCVLRGDLNNITVNSFSNIQDRSIIHAAR
jgi:hypothetical protein